MGGELSVYLFFVFVSLCAGAVGSISSRTGIRDWYPTLKKPSWTPPNWIFAPVWTLLYVLMGVAMGIVYNATTGTAQILLTILFVVHLIVNAFWSYAFFGKCSPRLAFYDILVLWLLILVLAALFVQVDALAGFLMAPYVAWVSFALTLNASIMGLNTK